jgi:hypothetical protein
MKTSSNEKCDMDGFLRDLYLFGSFHFARFIVWRNLRACRAEQVGRSEPDLLFVLKIQAINSQEEK